MTSAQEHPEVLLPWYVNHTLSGDELELVEQHLATCEQCRTEVAALQQMRDGYKQQHAAQSPGSLGLARLKAEIKRNKREQQKENLSRPSFLWWRPMMAAAVLVIVIQSVLLVRLERPEDTITPLSGKPAAEVVLQVRFNPQATERQIREALTAVDGEIVSGPGALGIYRITLNNVKSDQQEVITQALTRLKENTSVVEFVSSE
jgi:anti-sigma-K factor RskA